MKRIKYVFLSTEINHGTEENPNIEQIFISKDFRYSEESHEAAKREAYKGEYEIYDDGLPEPVVEPTAEEMFNALLGVTE
jgi:hypothetical protein